MKIKKRVLNDALRVLGKVVCQTSPVELYRSVRNNVPLSETAWLFIGF